MIDTSTLTREQKELMAAAIIEKSRRRSKTDCVFFIKTYLKTFDPRPDALSSPPRLHPIPIPRGGGH
jgi:hypothetical protein